MSSPYDPTPERPILGENKAPTAFDRVKVDYAVMGGARIWWELNRHFIDPGPYIFQLQVGHTALEKADDWQNVGSPVVDTYMAFDLEKRLFGKTQDVHYRVQLTTPLGVYYSMTAPSLGLLTKRDWLIYREMTRKEMLRHRVQTSVPGYLLKARRYGPRCQKCGDKFTEEITNSHCPVCYGTGFEFGYFTPLPAYFADVGMPQVRDHRDPNKGMDKEYTIIGRFIGDPQLYSYDVWCNGHSDERYYIHTTAVKAQVRGIPVVVEAELRLAPFTDVIYTFPLNRPFVKRSEKPQELQKPQKPQKLQEHTKNEKPCPRKPIIPNLTYLEAALAELKERRARSSGR